MTTREIFDTVKNHLLTQMRKSEPDHISRHECYEGCAYRGADGLRCAIGILINNEAYDKILEEKPVDNINVIEAIQKSIGREISKHEVNMLKVLQNTHDDLQPDEWKARLNGIEQAYFPE